MSNQQSQRSPDQRTENQSAQQSGSNRSSTRPAGQFRTSPTIKPTLVWVGLTVSITVALTGVFVTNPQLLGGADTAGLANQVIAVLGTLVLLRLLIRMFILTRTEYIIDSQSVKRRYSLLLQARYQEVPIRMIRSSDLKQGRIQRMLGYGTVRLNEGLGGLYLEHVENPRAVHKRIAEYLSYPED